MSKEVDVLQQAKAKQFALQVMAHCISAEKQDRHFFAKKGDSDIENIQKNLLTGDKYKNKGSVKFLTELNEIMLSYLQDEGGRQFNNLDQQLVNKQAKNMAKTFLKEKLYSKKGFDSTKIETSRSSIAIGLDVITSVVDSEKKALPSAAEVVAEQQQMSKATRVVERKGEASELAVSVESAIKELKLVEPAKTIDVSNAIKIVKKTLNIEDDKNLLERFVSEQMALTPSYEVTPANLLGCLSEALKDKDLFTQIRDESKGLEDSVRVVYRFNHEKYEKLNMNKAMGVEGAALSVLLSKIGGNGFTEEQVGGDKLALLKLGLAKPSLIPEILAGKPYFILAIEQNQGIKVVQEVESVEVEFLDIIENLILNDFESDKTKKNTPERLTEVREIFKNMEKEDPEGAQKIQGFFKKSPIEAFDVAVGSLGVGFALKEAHKKILSKEHKASVEKSESELGRAGSFAAGLKQDEEQGRVR